MIVTAPAGHHAHCKCCKKNKNEDSFRTVMAKRLRQPVECVLTNKQWDVKKWLPQHQQVMLIANAVRRSRNRFFRTVMAKGLQCVECILTVIQRDVKKWLPQYQQVVLIANTVRRSRTKIYFRTVMAKRLQPGKCILLIVIQRDIKKYCQKAQRQD